MKDFFKYFFASLLAILISGVILGIVVFGIIGAAVSSIGKESPVIVKKNAILLIDLGQKYNEIGHEEFSTIISGGPKPVGLLEVLASIEKAKTDDNIKGIYIKANAGSNGLSSLQELRAALEDFRSSGKFIISYSDMISQMSYYVASVSDSIYINPLGHVEVKGLATSIMFYKGLLDKLEVKPEIFYCGQFKSATEPFRLKEMSEQNRKQLSGIQEDIWDEVITKISASRGLDTATINGYARELKVQTASDAIAAKLIDGIKYKDEIESMLKAKIGQDQNDKEVDMMNIKDYARTLSLGANKDKIAVVVGEGQILDGDGTGSLYEITSNKFIKEIRKVRDNDDIKGVVIRINSPGGSALASEVILRELDLLRKKKPYVVSMGDVAASGGYYIACHADSIFAMPNTITGSIGVFAIMMNPQGLLNNKLGITFDTEKNMPYADFMNLSRPISDFEKNVIQTSIDSMYLTFRTRVAEGRKTTVAYVDSVGQGRIWTGQDALTLGLVDGIGGIDRAIQSVAAIAGISDYSIRVYPSPVNQMEDLLKNIQGQNDDKVHLESLMKQQFTEEYRAYQMLRAFGTNPTGMWMYLPYSFDIR
ncbi:MAG: signal peptide peptidase SppA [Taibaiella sp.]|nr:signal peptide peptidase SppA [Taibaiella sp.]